MLEAEHGKIAVRVDDSYGWLGNAAKTREGREVSVKGLGAVATINCMWSGGGHCTVYAMSDIEAVSISPQIRNIIGYCQKCNSYCYGDCEANQ
ncbi:MAG: hypothetical protein GF311_28260 [Candidatus Lokiarchaeota archaeon]|nr:hypothetical protein [Candidatus Lokiarchaeota archaeon]